jgi:hypothetical protein
VTFVIAGRDGCAEEDLTAVERGHMALRPRHGNVT